jgi:hypothetical protein
MTLLSKVSPYQRQANTAVNTASSVSIKDALEPLVCCKPQTNATGPITAPEPAMAKSLGQSDRRKPASLAAGCFKAQATSAAPAYSKAAVEKVPTP